MYAFFTGMHNVKDAGQLRRVCVSVNRLINRVGGFHVNDWIMDSGAFTQITTHGDFVMSEQQYVTQINKWYCMGRMLAAVTQDYMCEAFALSRTGKTVSEHQELTVSRFDNLLELKPHAYIMPVLQGYLPEEYVRHALLYGRRRLRKYDWVGVGSVCKRNANPHKLYEVLAAIKSARPDLLLHGFGVKQTALQHPQIRKLLFSADSMAWSFAARMRGKNGNDWREAAAFACRIESMGCRTFYQRSLFYGNDK